MVEEFVGFLIRGGAVVPRNFNSHTLGDQRALERLKPIQYGAGDDYGICTWPLGDGDSHCGPRAECTVISRLYGPDTGIRFGTCNANVCDITQVDDAPTGAANLEPFELMNGIHAVSRLNDQ